MSNARTSFQCPVCATTIPAPSPSGRRRGQRRCLLHPRLHPGGALGDAGQRPFVMSLRSGPRPRRSKCPATCFPRARAVPLRAAAAQARHIALDRHGEQIALKRPADGAGPAEDDSGPPRRSRPRPSARMPGFYTGSVTRLVAVAHPESSETRGRSQTSSPAASHARSMSSLPPHTTATRRGARHRRERVELRRL